MYIYNGKINVARLDNETFTLVVPGEFVPGDPICGYWQSSGSAWDRHKANHSYQSIITNITKKNGGYSVLFSLDIYHFEGPVAQDFSTLKLAVREENGNASTATMILHLHYSNESKMPLALIYTGKLHWHEYAIGEMVTVVVPAGFKEGSPICLYYQWTHNAAGISKAVVTLQSSLQMIKTTPDGTIFARVPAAYYIYDIQVGKNNKELVLRMTNPTGERDALEPYYLKQTDSRSMGTKKCMLVSYATAGTSKSIFRLKEMLIKYFAFAEDDIDMSYYDIEITGHRKVKSGQDPPTAERFKKKFVNLASHAQAKDVVFVYLDASGAASLEHREPGGSNDKTGGWVLAGSDNGDTEETVGYNWLIRTIRDNIKPAVNLTILTTLWMDRAVQDAFLIPTSGIFLGACHGIQSNVNVADGADPWTTAIVGVIENLQRSNCGIPSYAVLVEEARLSMRTGRWSGDISATLRASSSLEETKPDPQKQGIPATQQDPQLLFHPGYVDVGTERFLCPFFTSGTGRTGGEMIGRSGSSPIDAI